MLFLNVHANKEDTHGLPKPRSVILSLSCGNNLLLRIRDCRMSFCVVCLRCCLKKIKTLVYRMILSLSVVLMSYIQVILFSLTCVFISLFFFYSLFLLFYVYCIHEPVLTERNYPLRDTSHAATASQNHHSLRLLGGWATSWSAEEMLNGQHQRVDIPAHARTACKGLLLKRLEENRPSYSSDDPIGQGTELN